MNYSIYQQDFFDVLPPPRRDNVLLEAVAGSGKTTTAIEAMRQLPEASFPMYLAFNKHIATEFEEKLSVDNIQCDVLTFNAAGHRALGRLLGGKLQVSKFKSYNILKELNLLQGDEFQFLRKQCVRLVSLAKANYLMPDEAGELEDLIDHMGLVLTDQAEIDLVVRCACAVLERSQELTKDSVIDFDDQLYESVRLRAPLMKRTHVFVDEAQDTNRVQAMMLPRMVSDSGRIFIIGDRRQAIYAFRGADAGAMDHLSERFSCTELPLSICYRCPKEVVRLAQKIVPQIEFWEDAPEGDVIRYHTGEPMPWIALDEEGTHMVLCRVNAPLISLAYKFMKQQRPFTIVGKEFGERIKEFVTKVIDFNQGDTTLNIEHFEDKLYQFQEVEAKKLEERGFKGGQAALDDIVDALALMCDFPDINDTQDLEAMIDRLFHGSHGTRLSTIHRAKGAEAHHVYILDPELLPHPKAESPVELEQEKNLEYVAITRAQRTLTFIHSNDFGR